MAISDTKPRPKPGPCPPPPESSAPPPSTWAKRTGFRPKFSGEANVGDSGQISLPPRPREPDLEAGRARPRPQPQPQPPPAVANGQPQEDKQAAAPNPCPAADKEKDQPAKKRRDSDVGAPKNSSLGANRRATPTSNEQPPPPRRQSRNGETVDAVNQASVDEDGFMGRPSHMNYELRASPGLVPIGFFGFQHYLSILGSLMLTPLVIVPAMGGKHEDVAAVVSTVLFVSGVTTLLHTSFGSRLPLIQGPSFVYLAPILAIINSPEFQGLKGNTFKHIMKEIQGAVIIASAFQTLLGYSGLMGLLVRLINPVVVSPTVAAVGLSFYSYGFPLVGNCLEIGILQILLVITFSLYLRKISVLGHRIFLIYAVPLGLAISWAAAFLLTEAGAYTYKGCDWGTPVFNWKLAIVMCAVSMIASVDSVGSYHASALLVASRPPTPGVLSRGIGLEGLSSVLAGLWGTGTGSSTLTENVHTIAVTKMGSRKAVEVGACFLILLSLVGKVGGFIASIPQVMVAALLCFMWAMLSALGLSNLRYSEAGSSRNIIIVGLSLFFSFSIPAYFQQYGVSPNGNLSVPSYFQPYIVASHGPFHTPYHGLNYVMNTLLALHMVISFLVAFILDNTVPGSKQERGVYVWSEREAARREPSVAKDYELPFRVSKFFRWVEWVGL